MIDIDVKMWFQDRWSWVQRRVSAIICVFAGHMPVDKSALWSMVRCVVGGDIDAVCLRCGKLYPSLMRNFFEPGPLFRKLTGTFSGGDSMQTPFMYAPTKPKPVDEDNPDEP